MVQDAHTKRPTTTRPPWRRAVSLAAANVEHFPGEIWGDVRYLRLNRSVPSLFSCIFLLCFWHWVLGFWSWFGLAVRCDDGGKRCEVGGELGTA